MFYGFNGWVGLISGRTSCGWWPEDPSNIGFDQKRLIHNDLANNPRAVRDGRISVDQIEVDDAPIDGALTKLGPTWPAGSWINSIWLESSHWDNLDPTVQPPRHGAHLQGHAYEMTSVLYWDGPLAGRRFWGHYVEIESENKNQALVSVWPRGHSQTPGQQHIASLWLDLSSRAHPLEPGLTEVGVGSSPKKGALFLETSVAIIPMAKAPPFMGGVRIPEPSR